MVNSTASTAGEPPRTHGTLNEFFHRFSHASAAFTGSPYAFILACSTIVVWLITGPLFRYSDAWQLVINTSTTIITFLMVFLIQNQQNRDAKVMHLKLDELLRAGRSARNDLIELEDCTDEELKLLEEEFRQLHQAARLRRLARLAASTVRSA